MKEPQHPGIPSSPKGLLTVAQGNAWDLSCKEKFQAVGLPHPWILNISIMQVPKANVLTEMMKSSGIE